jgi:hypothetical protein
LSVSLCFRVKSFTTEEHEQFTTLARHRTQVTKKLRQTKSHIKSMLLFHGIKVPDEFDNSN